MNDIIFNFTVKGMVLSILDQMTNKQYSVSTTYVKIMFPWSSAVHVPTRMGYPMSVRHSTEILFSLGLEDVKMRLTKDSSQQSSDLPYNKMEISGSVKPL